MTRLFVSIALLLLSSALGQSKPSAIEPQTVTIPSGNLQLKAFLWKPSGPGPFPTVVFNHGSGGPSAADTAGMPLTEAAGKLGPLFVKHGYAFLFLFRRGQGLSADQGVFMQDLLQREEKAKGQDARQRLQFALLTTEQLDDVLAALSYLKTVPEIDPHRLAMVGHSFGGQLTLLAGEHETSLRAEVTFGAAANSWKQSPELRERLLAAVRKTSAAVMLIHAANDYDTAPGKDLAAELEHAHKPHVLKIFPPVGQTHDDGHNAVYTSIPQWEGAVFQFLSANLRTNTSTR
jgi:carboxymethylenebutenolidase